MGERRVRLASDQVFARAAGAPLLAGNDVVLLRDAQENYPAWKKAMAAARRYIHFETYIFHDDEVGREFAALLKERAAAGVKVRLIYDWLGGFAATPRRFWQDLRTAGVEVRCFNPPNMGEPLGWLRRDHRKSLVVDDELAFVTGLCIGCMWTGNVEKRIAPWRDTGVELRGPAVREVALAFAEMWSTIGPALPAEDEPLPVPPPKAGEKAVRVVAATPGTAGIFRVDLAVASAARRTLWLTDAYYAGSASYVQALRAAAQDGVDVRILVPGRGSDIAIVQAISRAGYRSLLEAGIRVFEWNGPMIHAKTAVADGLWARVGSTNLNLASWVGNWELDLVIEDESFAREMEAQYEEDLMNSTEIVLEPLGKVLAVGGAKMRRLRGAGGGATRAAVGAVRLGNVLTAAITSRVLGPAEAKLMVRAGLMLVLMAPLGIFVPELIAWPLALFSLWMGISLFFGAVRASQNKKP